MARKSEITREMIIDAGLSIIRTEGYSQLSARNLAKHLGCSTQPVYYCFKNIEELDVFLIRKAYACMMEYMQKDCGEDAFLQMGLGYIAFAKEESNLFEYLYFSHRNKGVNESEYSILVNTAKQGYGMGKKDETAVKRIHEKLSLFVHGMAVTLMNNPQAYTKDEIRSLLVDTAVYISKGEGENEKD